MAAWKLPLSLILAVLIGTVGLADDDQNDDDAEELIDPVVQKAASQIEQIRPSKVQRANFERQLELQIQILSLACDLSVSQKEKLKLAGQMEIQRLFAQIESGLTHAVQQKTFIAMKLAVRDLVPLLNAARSESTTYAFREGSFVHKVAASVLSPEQLQNYRAAMDTDGSLRRTDRRELIPSP